MSTGHLASSKLAAIHDSADHHAALPPPSERPMCAVCKHFDCKAAEGTDVCIFCEDGVACLVAREAISPSRRNPSISAAPVLVGDKFQGRTRVDPEEEERAMKLKKKCACGKGIRAGKNGVAADQCRACRIKSGEFNKGGTPRAARTSADGEEVASRRSQQVAGKKRGGKRKAKANGELEPTPGVITVAIKEAAIEKWWAELPRHHRAQIFANNFGQVPEGALA